MPAILIRKIWRDLSKSKTQTIALVFVIVLGVSSYISLVSAYRDLKTSYDYTYNRLSFADITFQIIPQETAIEDTISRLADVAAVSSRLIVDASLSLTGERIYTAKENQIRCRLIGIPADEHLKVNDVLVLEGRYFQPGDSKVVLVESHFANTYSIAPGDTVTPILNGKKLSYRVVGIVASPEYLIVSPNKQEIIPTARTFAVLFMPVTELQDLTGMTNQVNNLAIIARPLTDMNILKETIKKHLQANGLVESTLRKDQPSNNALLADLEGYREISFLMPLIILLVATSSVYILLGRQVRAQQQQIGLMKALGYQNGSIIASYLSYALFIGILGCSVGVPLSIFMGGGITSIYAQELGIPMVRTRFYLDLVWQGVVLSILFSLMGGIGPALSSSRLPPAHAMRLDPSIALVAGRRSILERFLPLPIWLRVTIRNVFRARRRFVSTATGIIFAFVLTLMTWTMRDSMGYLFYQQFNVVNRWDALVVFSNPKMRGLSKIIRNEWQGVRKVEPIVQLPATIKANGQEKDIFITGLNPRQDLFALQIISGSRPEEALANSQIVLTSALANRMNLIPGDSLTLTILGDKRTVVLGGVCDEMITSNAYLDYQTARMWTGAPTGAGYGFYITLDPARADQIRSAFYKLDGIATVRMKDEIEKEWKTLFGLFYVFMGMMLFFSLGMAFALLFNTSTVNVLERQRELATMRSIGSDRRLITRYLLSENFILWLVTLLPGMLLGAWTAQQMAAAFQTDLIIFKVVVYPQTYAISAMCILITIMLSALPSIRYVNNLNLAESTKTIT